MYSMPSPSATLLPSPVPTCTRCDAGAAGAGRDFGQYRRRVHDAPIPHRCSRGGDGVQHGRDAAESMQGRVDRCPVRAAAHRQHGVGDAEQVEFGQQSLADGQGQRVHTRGEAVGGAEVGRLVGEHPQRADHVVVDVGSGQQRRQGQDLDAAPRLQGPTMRRSPRQRSRSAEAAQVGLVEDHHPGRSGPVKRGGVLGFDCLGQHVDLDVDGVGPGQDGGTPAAQGPADGGAAGARSSGHAAR